MVAPVLHKYVPPETRLDVKTVLPPVQKLAVPLIVGVAGKAVTVIVLPVLAAEVQPVTVFLILNE